PAGPGPPLSENAGWSSGLGICARDHAGSFSFLPVTAALLQDDQLVQTPVNRGAPSASVQHPVQALVVERAAHRRELVTEGAHVLRHGVRVERLAVLPHLDHGEMVGPIALL